MTMILLGYLVSAIAGFLLVRALWPGPMRWDGDADWYRLATGSMVGVGVTSIAAFLNYPHLAADASILAVAAVLFVAVGRSGDRETTPESAPPKALSLIVLGTLAVFAAAYVTMVLPNPYGELDSWRIWNFRARFLYRGGTLAELNNPLLSYTHPELPYLVTSSVMRLWRWAGSDSPLAAVLLAGSYGFSLIGIVYGALRAVRSQTQGLLGLAAILASTAITGNAATQFADLPFAAFLAASFGAIAIAERLPATRLYLVAGLAAGFLPWTKTEGWYYFVPLLAIALWRGRALGGAFFALASLPGVAMAAYFIANIAPSTPAIQATFPALAGAMVSRLLTVSLFGWVVTPILVLSAYAYFLGLRRGETRKRELWISTALLLVGGIAAILMRDDNPGDSAAFRILLHCWPVFLIALFLQLNGPEDLVQGSQPAKAKLRK